MAHFGHREFLMSEDPFKVAQFTEDKGAAPERILDDPRCDNDGSGFLEREEFREVCAGLGIAKVPSVILSSYRSDQRKDRTEMNANGFMLINASSLTDVVLMMMGESL